MGICESPKENNQQNTRGSGSGVRGNISSYNRTSNDQTNLTNNSRSQKNNQTSKSNRNIYENENENNEKKEIREIIKIIPDIKDNKSEYQNEVQNGELPLFHFEENLREPSNNLYYLNEFHLTATKEFSKEKDYRSLIHSNDFK